MTLSNRATSFPIKWEGIEEISPIVKAWADILYTEERFANYDEGKDIFVNTHLEDTPSNDKLIVTRWGKNGIRSSFHCISGYQLFDMMPWWEKFQSLIESSTDLHSWLPFPCILLSEANLRRHSDKGRPTAFNYPIFGLETIDNYLWYDSELSDDSPSEKYEYKTGETILIDTTVEHGGFMKPNISPLSTRAICNLGFHERYDDCLNSLNNKLLLEKITDL